MEIISNAGDCGFAGCDFVARFPAERKDKPIKLLQLTDMQIIDSAQRRSPDRLRIDEINAWHPDNMDRNVFHHIKSLIAQTLPDLIFITGDMVYGSFDDAGTTFIRFCEFMDSLEIPWMPVFGNHDNESQKGAEWQCDLLENAKHCLFRRGAVSGHGNYTVGIAIGDQLIRVIHLLDSHGCLRERGLCPDQLDLVRKNTALIRQNCGRRIPALLGFHHPTQEFQTAAIAKGYETEERRSYMIGVDVEAKDGDFGSKQENFKKSLTISIPGFMEMIKTCHIDGVFVGHFHSINTCITYDGVKWVYGLKTGQYDYHTPGQLGGTLINLEREQINVSHVPALVNYAPFAGGCCIFENFFAESKELAE